MQFNVAQLLKQPIGAVRKYELTEAIEGLDPDLHPASPLTGTLRLLRTNSGILATGRLTVDVEVACSRCMEPIVVPIEIELAESFRPLAQVDTGRFIHPDDFEGDQEDLFDEALLIDEKHILDISEVVRQNLWLSMPMYPACTYDRPEECPNYQLRLQEMAEAHSDMPEEQEGEEEIDPRWAALLQLRRALDSE